MRAFPTEKRVKPSPEWNHYRVTCIDGDVSLEVNGKLVTQGKNSKPRKGFICLESEGSPTEMRNIRIMELPGEPLADELVANQATGMTSLFNGLDTAGWKTEGADAWKVTGEVWRGKSTGAEVATLSTDDTFGAFKVRFDWRWRESESPQRSLKVKAGDRKIAALTEKDAGKKLNDWQRFEKHVEGSQQAHDAAIRFELEQGVIELRNIFVERLETTESP